MADNTDEEKRATKVSFAASERFPQANDDLMPDYTAMVEPELPKKKTKAEKRALKKAAKKLQKEEQKRILLRDKLRQELELSKTNQAYEMSKIEALCAELKLKEFREELLLWCEETGYNLDRKNTQIDKLLSDIEFFQEDFQRGYAQRINFCESLKETYNDLQQECQQTYKTLIKRLLQELCEAMLKRTTEVQQMKKHVECSIFAESHYKSNELKDYSFYSREHRDDIIGTGIFQRFGARDRAIRDMLQQKDALTAFFIHLRSTRLERDVEKNIKEMKRQHKQFYMESKQYKTDELVVASKLQKIKEKLLEVQRNADRIENDLQKEFDFYEIVRKKLAKAIRLDREITYKKIKAISTECYFMMKDLDVFIKKCTMPQTIMYNCLRLQTEAEKIMTTEELIAKEEDSVDNKRLQEILEEKKKNMLIKCNGKYPDIQMLEDLEVMKPIFIRTFMIEEQNIIMSKDNSRLKAENKKLIDFIKKLNSTGQPEDMLKTIIIQPCFAKKEKLPKLCKQVKKSAKLLK